MKDDNAKAINFNQANFTANLIQIQDKMLSMNPRDIVKFNKDYINGVWLPLVKKGLENGWEISPNIVKKVLGMASEHRLGKENYRDYLLKNETFKAMIEDAILSGKKDDSLKVYLKNEKIHLIDGFQKKLSTPNLDGIILLKIINYKKEDHDYYQDSGNKLPPIYNDLLALKNAGNINGMKQAFLLVIKMEGFNALYSDLGDINVRNNISNPVIKEVMSELLKHDDIRLNLLPIEIENSLKDIKNLIPNNTKALEVVSKIEEHLKDSRKVFKKDNIEDLKKFSEDLNKGYNDLKNAKNPTTADKILDSILNVIGVFTDKLEKFTTHAKAERATDSIHKALEKGPTKGFAADLDKQRTHDNPLHIR